MINFFWCVCSFFIFFDEIETKSNYVIQNANSQTPNIINFRLKCDANACIRFIWIKIYTIAYRIVLSLKTYKVHKKWIISDDVICRGMDLFFSSPIFTWLKVWRTSRIDQISSEQKPNDQLLSLKINQNSQCARFEVYQSNHHEIRIQFA